MEHRDALGRRRRPGQSRGLRPLYPVLPGDVRSRAVRLAMSAPAWQALDGLARSSAAPTQPRAYGAAIETLLLSAPEVAATRYDATSDWLDWQARKERRLLERSA